MRELKVGDRVMRLLGGEVEMALTITEIDARFIHCGPWKFDKRNGIEVDEELGWGEQADGTFMSGSSLVFPKAEA